MTKRPAFQFKERKGIKVSNAYDKSFTVTIQYSALSKQIELHCDSPELKTDPLAVLQFLLQSLPALVISEFQMRKQREENFVKNYGKAVLDTAGKETRTRGWAGEN